jgi:hypothetical protein
VSHLEYINRTVKTTITESIRPVRRPGGFALHQERRILVFVGTGTVLGTGFHRYCNCNFCIVTTIACLYIFVTRHKCSVRTNLLEISDFNLAKIDSDFYLKVVVLFLGCLPS